MYYDSLVDTHISHKPWMGLWLSIFKNTSVENCWPLTFWRKMVSPSSYLRYESTYHTNSVFGHGAWTGENDAPDHHIPCKSPFLCGFDMISILLPKMLRETDCSTFTISPESSRWRNSSNVSPTQEKMWRRPRNHKARLSQLLGPAMVPTAGEADVLAGPGVRW